MSPAYDGLSEEERNLSRGTHRMHTCNNAIPVDDAECRFCHRANDKSTKSTSYKMKQLEKKNIKLESEVKRLKAEFKSLVTDTDTE